MSRTVLLVIGVLLVLMGVAGLVPNWELATEPLWHAIAKVVVGVVGIAVAISDKK